MVDIGLIMSFEQGELDEDESIALFQALIDSGQINHLQGSYGRTAMHLIRIGACTVPGQVNTTNVEVKS